MRLDFTSFVGFVAQALPVSRLLLTASLLLCLVAGCAEPMAPEHVAAISKMQGLGGRVVYAEGGYRLNMRDSRVQDEDLSFLKDIKDLKTLDIRGTQISDASVDTIIAQKSLMAVLFTGSHVTPEGIKRVKEARPDLEITR